jgi:hypothetical protein
VWQLGPSSRSQIQIHRSGPKVSAVRTVPDELSMLYTLHWDVVTLVNRDCNQPIGC